MEMVKHRVNAIATIITTDYWTLRIQYRGFSPKPPGGWGFFSAILGNASINKNPTPWGFSQVFGWDFVFATVFTNNQQKPIYMLVGFSFRLV